MLGQVDGARQVNRVAAQLHAELRRADDRRADPLGGKADWEAQAPQAVQQRAGQLRPQVAIARASHHGDARRRSDEQLGDTAGQDDARRARGVRQGAGEHGFAQRPPFGGVGNTAGDLLCDAAALFGIELHARRQPVDGR